MAKKLWPRTFWLSALLASGLLVAFVVYLPMVPPSKEVARQHSPDGWYDAVLMEVPRDAAGAHSYWVCLQRPPRVQVQVTRGTCKEVAFLSGVVSQTLSPPVTLVWTSRSRLEIRYDNATAINIYTPLYPEWAARFRHPRIFTTAVRTADAPPDNH
jgi:hypothetical protein